MLRINYSDADSEMPSGPKHAYLQRFQNGLDLRDSFQTLLSLLEANRPRKVDVNFFEWMHMYVDASYDPKGHSGIGGFLLNDRGDCLGFFSEKVGTSRIQRSAQRQASSSLH